MLKIYACLPLFSWLFCLACSGPSNSKIINNHSAQTATPKSGEQIGEYVVNVFEDSKGRLWFATIGKGVARYDGKTLTYLSTADGLCGDVVTGMAEDKAGNMWLGTHSGLARYDGKTFTIFTTNEGLSHHRVSMVLIDRTGQVWVATWGGVCRYNGVNFTPFPLPNPDVEIPPYQATANWVTDIMEDRDGNIWFSRSGYGACKYDGQTFTTFTKKDGLPSNCVQAMLQDRQGQIWFGCRVAEKDHPEAAKRSGDGGLSRYDGQTFTHFPSVAGLSKNDVYALHQDQKGNVWIGANGHGLYRYDGKNFTLFHETDRKDLMPYGYGIQSILSDKKGRIWLGLSGGLFRLDGSTIANVTQDGPWQ